METIASGELREAAMKHFQSPSLRYAIESRFDGYLVFDNLDQCNVETQLEWDEAQALVDELTGEDTDLDDEDEYDPFDGDYCHADHFTQFRQGRRF